MPDEKKRTYRAEAIGLPPLKMVLVHAANDRAKPILIKPRPRLSVTQEEAIKRLIEHLTKLQDQ
jgi:hypothetical protein